MIVPTPKRITSSTNNKCVRIFELVIFRPFSWPSLRAFFRSRPGPRTMIRKRKGDRGHPWQSSREAWKNCEGVPFMRTATEEDSMHPIIQLTIFRSIAIWMRGSLTKVQLTLSYAFERSSFITIEGIFFNLMKCKASWVRETASLKMGLRWFAMIFATSLYIRLQHAIGRKSSKEAWTCFLGIRARKVEFKDPKILLEL